jgi:Mn-dependent DtxR family transcriptional regulator
MQPAPTEDERVLRVLAALSLKWPVFDADCEPLERKGYVERNGGEWVLTDEGEAVLLMHLGTLQGIRLI